MVLRPASVCARTFLTRQSGELLIYGYNLNSAEKKKLKNFEEHLLPVGSNCR